MKKVIAVSLVLCLLSSALSACKTAGHSGDETTTFRTESTAEEPHSAPESPVSDFEYEVNEDGGITIIKYIGKDADVVIPAKMDGKMITKIGAKSFFQNQSIVSIKMSDAITMIEYQAFEECISLTDVDLPLNIKSIKSRAFAKCVKLSGMILPEALQEICDEVFEECKSLKQMHIPGNVAELSEGAFANSGLETITLEEGLKVIGNMAFCGTKIKKIVMPQSVKVIKFAAFINCYDLECVILNNGLEWIEHAVFTNSKLQSVIIPETVTHINEATFHYCRNLKEIKFEGDAPDNYKVDEIEISAGQYIIYYHSNATGFTTPTWNGYPTEIW